MNGHAVPSMDQWIKEARSDPAAKECGMFLFHNGIVRESARDKVRNGREDAPSVRGMLFDYDENALEAAVAKAYDLPGIYYVRVWLNRGELSVGDDIMLVLIGGDIRPRVVDALNFLVGEIKGNCVAEKEVY